MQFLLLRQALLLLGAGLASYTDLKTGLIYDKITLPLIAAGVVLNLFELQALQFFFLAGLVFAAGYILYYLGKIGGGDVKLFTGLALLLPWQGQMPFILNALFFAGITAVLFLGVYYLIKYYRLGINFKENQAGLIRAGLLGAFVLVYFIFVSVLGLMPLPFVLFLAPPLFFALVFIALEQGIRKNFFLKSIALKDLEEDEIIAFDFMDKSLLEKLNLQGKRVIGEKEKQKLKELKVKEILVYRDLPRFAPFVFLGSILALLFPDFFFFFSFNAF